MNQRDYLYTASNLQAAIVQIRELAEILYGLDAPNPTKEVAAYQATVDAMSAAIIAMCEKAERENEV